MCEKFNTEHPEWDLTFEYGVCSEQDAGKTVPQDPSNSADVYFFANDQLQTLIDAKAIAKLGGETADYVKYKLTGNCRFRYGRRSSLRCTIYNQHLVYVLR